MAKVQEEGSRPISIRMTPKMRRFLFAMFGRSRNRPVEGPPEGGTGIIVVRIPARPFLRPVFDKFAKKTVIRQRFLDRVAICFRGQFGKPRTRPPK